LADKHDQSRLTDNARHHVHAHPMGQPKDTSDELYVLGFIAGLCNHEPRYQLLLDDMLMYLREAQDSRRQSSNLPD
jgi:hypothetical protein